MRYNEILQFEQSGRFFKVRSYRGVWFLSACAYIPTAREVGLIIQDALNKQVKLKWVWPTLRATIDQRVDVKR